MRRRAFLAGLAACAAWPAVAHTPYGQWLVYRQKHLIIGCHKAEPRTYDTARSIADALAEALPEASARVARAPTAGRIAALMATEQMDVAVLTPEDAAGMAAGRDSFAPYGAVPLSLLAPLGDLLLVAHPRVPERHAWMLSAALDGEGVAVPGEAGLALHPGARMYRAGLPMPGDGAE